MNQEEINEICKKLGVSPILDMPIPSEMEFEEMFENCGCHAYDDDFEQAVAYNNFKAGYMISEIKRRIK